MKIGILGVPFNGDSTRPEAENPAAALRQAGLTRLQSHVGHTLLDYGDIAIPAFQNKRDPITGILNDRAWRQTARRTADKLFAIQKDTNFTILLGGDCSILLGICGAFGLAGRRVGLVFLDGHTDYRHPAASPTGEPADLELAVITGLGPRAVTGLFGPPPLVQPDDVVVCGYREPDLIAESTIFHFDCHAFRQTGASKMARQTLSILGHLDRLWLHLDVDVLDPAVMPVCFPEPDGLTMEAVAQFLSTSLGSGRFIGLSISCYHPDFDPGLNAATRLVDMLCYVLSEGANSGSPGD